MGDKQIDPNNLPTLNELRQMGHDRYTHLLAEKIISIIGVRHHWEGKHYVCVRDMKAHKESLLQLLPEVTMVLKPTERQSLYQLGERTYLENVIVRAVLRTDGHPLTVRHSNRKQDNGSWKTCTNWSLDVSLLDPVMTGDNETPKIQTLFDFSISAPFNK